MTDPRPQLTDALDQTTAQVAVLGAADLDRPTPCGDFDVRTLLAHVVAVVRKLSAAGRGEDTTQVPDPATDVSDAASALRDARIELDGVWADDALLGADCAMPWGVMSGHDLIDAYAYEFAGHNWDLAQLTGRADLLDPALAERALDWYRRNVPADGRGEGGPFGPVVEVPADADAYTRLAGYLGRPV